MPGVTTTPSSSMSVRTHSQSSVPSGIGSQRYIDAGGGAAFQPAAWKAFIIASRRARYSATVAGTSSA
jgi:hypothetical protein